MSAVALKRLAATKRDEAHTRMDTLRAKLTEQAEGKTEGGTRLTNEEITAETAAIEALIAEAKGYEGVDTLDGMMNQDPSRMTPAARELANAHNQGKEVVAGQQTRHFKSLGEFLRSVRSAQGGYDGYKMNQDQSKILRHLAKQATALEQGEALTLKEFGPDELKVLVGDDTGSAGRGDYLVPTETMSELLRVMGEQQQFANRTRRIPMARPTVIFPRLVQTDVTNTRPLFSFAAVTKIAEAATKPEREPTFDQLSISAVKYAAYVEASDELLVDSIIDLPPVLTDLLTSAISYEYDRDTMRGSGTGEPLGVLNSPAMLTIPREDPSSVTIGDLFNLEAHFFGTNGIWLFHQSAIPKIYALQSNNIVAWTNDLTAAVPGTLLGRAMVRTVKLPSLGNVGDFNLVDPSFYLTGEIQGITVANSIHYRFRNDVTAWRAVYRAAGTPWPAGTFANESDGSTMGWEFSPFVNLGNAVSS